MTSGVPNSVSPITFPSPQLYYEELCKKKGKKNLDLKAVARQKYKEMDPKKKLKYIAMSATELYTFEVCWFGNECVFC